MRELCFKRRITQVGEAIENEGEVSVCRRTNQIIVDSEISVILTHVTR